MSTEIRNIFTVNQTLAIRDANAPSAANVFATMADVGGGGSDIYTADGTIADATRQVTLANNKLHFQVQNTTTSVLSVGYEGGYGSITLYPARPAGGSNHRIQASGITMLNKYTAGNTLWFGNEVTTNNSYGFNMGAAPNGSYTDVVTIRGQGSTSATTSLLIENSSATELVKVNDDGSQVHDIGNSQFLIDGDTSGGTSSSFRVNTNGETLGFKTFFQIDDEGLVELRGSSTANGALKVYEDRSTNVTFSIKRQGDGFWLSRSGSEIIIGQALGGRAEFDNNWTSFKTSAAVEIHRLRVQGGNTTSWLNATGINAANQLIIGGTAVDGNESFSVFGATRITSTETDAPALEVASTTQGFLPPRMTTVQMNAVGSPATGLMVYDTTTNQWMGYNGTSWVILG